MKLTQSQNVLLLNGVTKMSIEQIKSKEAISALGAFFVFVILLALIAKDQGSASMVILCLGMIGGLMGYSAKELRKSEPNE